MNLHMEGLMYGKSLCPIIAGEIEVPSGYNNTDEGLLQWLSDNIQYERLYNNVLEFHIRGIFTAWLAELITPAQARQQMLLLFADHFDFAC